MLDDVFDVLEGALDEMVRVRTQATPGIDMLILDARKNQARCAVAALSALLRAGHAWHPAEDGYEASAWRDELLATLAMLRSRPAYVAIVERELGELIALSRPGPRRPLPPPGTFERLARVAGVPRYDCRGWARAVGRDGARGWTSCETSKEVVRIPLALGVSLDELVQGLCELLRAAAPGSARAAGTLATVERGIADATMTQLRFESAVEEALMRSLDAGQVREQFATPAMRARLAQEVG